LKTSLATVSRALSVQAARSGLRVTAQMNMRDKIQRQLVNWKVMIKVLSPFSRSKQGGLDVLL
jgi:hypothetical protein